MAGSSLAPDARGYLLVVPRRLTFFTDRYTGDQLWLNYGDSEVRGFKSKEAFLDAKLEIGDEESIFRYSDPPDAP